MKKVFINKKYLDQCKLQEGGTFVLQENFILSSYAKDYFIENQIKVVEEEETSPTPSNISTSTPEPDLASCIRKLLTEEYGVSSDILEEATTKILAYCQAGNEV